MSDFQIGDRRMLRCAAANAMEACAAPEWSGWRVISARSAPVMGRGLPRMVDVTMEYVGHDDE